MKSTVLSQKAKQAVEFCGRHPFATGLFAIISLIGIVFSFYGFVLDRADAVSTTSQIDSVAESIREIDENISRSASLKLDEELSVPIQVDIELPEYIDNIVFTSSHPVVDTKIRAEDAEAAMEAIRNSTSHSSSSPYFSFSVTSGAEKSFVQIAPYLLVEVVDAHSIQEELAGIYLSERGGGAVLREFSLGLYPVEGVQVAPMVDSMSGGYKEGIDYISLQPGEVEEFFLSLYFWPDHYYEFRIGLQIRFMGADSIVWLDKIFRRGVPSTQIPLYTWSSDTFRLAVHPDAAIDPSGTRSEVRESFLSRAREDIEQYERSRVFDLEMVGLDGPAEPSLP